MDRTHDRRRGRRSALGATLALGLVLAGPLALAEGATDARLQGSFQAKLTILTGDDPPPGTKLKRTYKFEALCKSGVCDKVKLHREASNGDIFKSILKRKKRGIYKGKKSFGVRCSGTNEKGTFTERHRVEIVKDAKGRATKLKGRSSYRSRGPGCDVNQKTKWVARR
ncbi:MAG TPA: hypothetical protein VFH44_11645 [Solirubrobacterales bacterium]|nr:hypothetical protein [Solirubrobacterales bacterium]